MDNVWLSLTESWNFVSLLIMKCFDVETENDEILRCIQLTIISLTYSLWKGVFFIELFYLLNVSSIGLITFSVENENPSYPN